MKTWKEMREGLIIKYLRGFDDPGLALLTPGRSLGTFIFADYRENYRTGGHTWIHIITRIKGIPLSDGSGYSREGISSLIEGRFSTTLLVLFGSELSFIMRPDDDGDDDVDISGGRTYCTEYIYSCTGFFDSSLDRMVSKETKEVLYDSGMELRGSMFNFPDFWRLYGVQTYMCTPQNRIDEYTFALSAIEDYSPYFIENVPESILMLRD